MTDVTIRGSLASEDGGAVFVDGGSVYMARSVIEDSHASRGGCAHVFEGTLEADESSFTGCSASTSAPHGF